MKAEDRLIIALDVTDLKTVKTLVEKLAPYCAMFKIGPVLTNAIGTPKAIKTILDLGGKVFFDGKFHDIPNTVSESVKQIVGLGVEMFTLHASVGREALFAAAQVKQNSKMIAVTVLTSMSNEQCLSMYGRTLINKVNDFGALAKDCGADGLVCSPLDIRHIDGKTRASMLCICPGIRPPWADVNDQRRNVTPRIAIDCGADYLVVGRPITHRPITREAIMWSPENATKGILMDMGLGTFRKESK